MSNFSNVILFKVSVIFPRSFSCRVFGRFLFQPVVDLDRGAMSPSSDESCFCEEDEAVGSFLFILAFDFDFENDFGSAFFSLDEVDEGFLRSLGDDFASVDFFVFLERVLFAPFWEFVNLVLRPLLAAFSSFSFSFSFSFSSHENVSAVSSPIPSSKAPGISSHPCGIDLQEFRIDMS